jgi:Peptidase family M28
MIDFRLYRLALVPALIAVVVVMFSLEGAPEPLEPGALRGEFDGTRAASLARQIVNTAPDRAPGSDGDAAVADIVAEHFGEITTGAVSQRRYEASYEGEDVNLRNVLLTLPGETDSTVLVVAARDAASAPGAASSAAATGILIELANTFRISHRLTYVLASVSGSSAGAAGVRELAENIPDPSTITAIVVISQPGAAELRPPFVIASSADTATASAQLVETAALAVNQQVDEPVGAPSAITQLARLAFPSGLGDQAPLIADGFDAVAISSAGERPLDSAADQPDDVAGESIDAFGRAVQSTVGALDFSTSAPIHGPATYVKLGSNLVPGWALSALALALIFPAAFIAFDLCMRSVRRGHAVGLAAAFVWAAARSLPFVGAIALLYALALIGLIPRPPFPFDPGSFGLGVRGAAAFVLIALAVAGSAVALRLRNVTADAAPAQSLVACGALAVLACLVIWLANPYLALLVAPLAHVWIVAAHPQTGRIAAAVATALALVPVVVALIAVAGALELGASAPWTLAIMVGNGQIGLLEVAAGCVLGGAITGAVVLSGRRAAPVDRVSPA